MSVCEWVLLSIIIVVVYVGLVVLRIYFKIKQ